MTENPQWQPVSPQQPVTIAAPPKKPLGGTIAICLSVVASGVIAGLLAWHPWDQPDPTSKAEQIEVVDYWGQTVDGMTCVGNDVGISCFPESR